MSNDLNEGKAKATVEEKENNRDSESPDPWEASAGYEQDQKSTSSEEGGIFGLKVDSLHAFQQAYNFEAKDYRANLSYEPVDIDNKHKQRDLTESQVKAATKRIEFAINKFPKTSFSKHIDGSSTRKLYSDGHYSENRFIPDTVAYKFHPPRSQTELVLATLDFIKYCTDRPFCPPIPSEEKRASLAKDIEGHFATWQIQGFPYNPFQEYTALRNSTVLVKTADALAALCDPHTKEPTPPSRAAATDEEDEQANRDTDNSVPTRKNKRRRY